MPLLAHFQAMRIRTLLLWLPMIPIAVANGIFREAVLAPRMDTALPHALSTLLLLLLFAAYIAAVLTRWPPVSRRDALWMGGAWLVLTLLFEFGLGFAGGRSFASMLSDYNILSGNLWVLIPLEVAVAPLIFAPSRRS